MTDRVSGFLVILEQDIRDDDAEATIHALKQIKGVLDVQPVLNSAIEGARIRQELSEKLWKVLHEK